MKTTFCLLMLILAAAVQAGDSSRANIVERMYEFMNIDLETSSDEACREDNLRHENLACNGCGHQTSDILWHRDFLDGQMGEIIWWGMPYAFGHGYLPDNGVQSAIDACKALGNHQDQYTADGCNYPGCDWSVGCDCSAAVCYAGAISRVGTSLLDSDAYGVGCGWDNMQKGTYIVKYVPPNPPTPAAGHVVLVSGMDGPTATILEQTGEYPVGRIADRRQEYYPNPPWHYRDFIDVASANGSEGLLIARATGAGIELVWTVESAARTRWYEFQYWNETDGVWVTFDEVDYHGVGEYRSTCSTAGAAGLIYRVRENEWGGRKLTHCETRARAAS